MQCLTCFNYPIVFVKGKVKQIDRCIKIKQVRFVNDGLKIASTLNVFVLTQITYIPYLSWYIALFLYLHTIYMNVRSICFLWTSAARSRSACKLRGGNDIKNWINYSNA